jgi:hypothetical protein
LNGNYKETGVAVVEGKINGENSILTVQVFGTKVVAIAEAKKTVLPEKAPEVAGVEKLPEVFSVEKIISESPITFSTPMDFVSKQKVAQQIQPIKNFLDSNTFTIQIVLLAALLSSLLAIKMVKIHKLSSALENKEKQELAAAAIAHTEYAGLWKRMELHWHKNRNDHSTEIRPG